MKQILFLGHYDKTDMMFYLGKLISMEHSVLIADATESKRYEYAYPKLDIEEDIHQYDGFDVMENVHSPTQLKERIAETSYDYVLIDIDHLKNIQEWRSDDPLFLVTSLDNSVLQRNCQMLNVLLEQSEASELKPITRIVQRATDAFTEEYLDELLNHLPIQWHDTFVYYVDERDSARKIHNQFSNQISMSKLSGEYKSVLKQMASAILEIDDKEAGRLWKRTERRRK
ncbi:hypothetical protein [Paenibacillus bouchesdurhonensis]|uniref:hypothetical protein n=1 Tax=Paenibacillus bouchesdurhonensis TaxID=1870990 RepID=UPI000DA608EE|nr:hypothetical protein [Paenibacillus bouchesdurhonensis]